MKIINKLLILLVVLLASCACSKNEQPTTNQNNNFPADGIIRVATSVTSPKTRAGMTTDDLNFFFLRIINNNNSAYNYYAQMEKKDGEWKSFVPSTSSNPDGLTLLWQNKSQKVMVSAVYMLGVFLEQDDWAKPIPFFVGNDQRSKIDILESDILYMKEKEIDPSIDLDINGKMQIALNHRLSKLNVTVKMGTEFNKLVGGTTNNLISKITVGGTYRNAYWKINEDKLSNYSFIMDVAPCSDTYKPGEGDNTQAEAKYECILIPQTVAAGQFKVSLKIGDRNFTWFSPQQVIFASDTQHNLTLIVGNNVVTLGGFSITPWSDQPVKDIETI